MLATNPALALAARLNAALKGAIAQKGKNKGLLKKTCPPLGTDAAAMWIACMMHANPYKVGMIAAMTAALRDPEFYDLAEVWADKNVDVVRRLDRDRNALESLGVW